MTTLLFDLFGVIACWQSETGRRRIEDAAGAKPDALWEAYWGQRQDYDRGDIDGRAYWRKVGAQLGVSFDTSRLDALVEADVFSWSEVDPNMVELVSRLADSGQRLGLLSNIPHEHAASFEPQNPWLNVFPVRAFSCRIGHAKPEPGAYLHCIDKLGVAADEILFIDDTPKNVAAAEHLGLQGHVFTTADALCERLGL